MFNCSILVAAAALTHSLTQIIIDRQGVVEIHTRAEHGAAYAPNTPPHLNTSGAWVVCFNVEMG
jgi:hypothetical protein